jgi:hypothetical protein
MNPFKCASAEKNVFLNHKSRFILPPDSVSAKLLSARAAASRYFASPVAACSLTSNEIPVPAPGPATRSLQRLPILPIKPWTVFVHAVHIRFQPLAQPVASQKGFPARCIIS